MLTDIKLDWIPGERNIELRFELFLPALDFEFRVQSVM